MPEPLWIDDPLAALIAPIAAETFFADYYERKALHAKRDEPDRYAGLLSVDRIDEILAGVDLSADSLEMARAEPRMQVGDFTHKDGVVDRGAVVRHYQQGATIILPHLHQLDATLAEFCRALEECLCSHIQTNAYLTPPDSQGFRTHYDDHDVFIVQVSGEKNWKFYSTPIENPYRGERFQSDVHEAGDPVHEFLLKAGECAYLPRGLMHDAVATGSEPSLHITVGVIVKTWADLMLEAVSEVALREPRFRRSLPYGFARDDYVRADAEAYFRDLIESFAKEANFDETFELFVENFIRSRSAVTRGGILSATEAIEPRDRFQRRQHVPARLRYNDEAALLIGPEGEVKFERAAVPGLEIALSGVPFSLEAFGDIDATLALESLKKLIAFGLVVKI